MSEPQDNVVSLQERERNAPTYGKADLLAHVGKVERPYFPEAQARIPIRRLGSSEWSEVEAMQASGISLEGSPGEDFDKDDPNSAKTNTGLKMKIDVQETTKGEADSRHQTVAYALSVNGEHWTKEEAGQIPNVALIRAIARKALELSGVSAEAQAEIRNFRENSGGGEPSVADDAGIPDSQQLSAIDASTGDVLDGSVTEGGSEA